MSLVTVQSRVSPISRPTIPRLELQAAVLSKCIKNVTESLSINVDSTYLWSDSTIALCWLKNNKTHEAYVQRRINIIQSTTEASQWHHVESSTNPADIIQGVVCFQI